MLKLRYNQGFNIRTIQKKAFPVQLLLC